MTKKKKMIAKPVTQVTGFRVNSSCYVDVVEEGDDLEYGKRDCTHSSWDVESVSVTNEYPDVVAKFEVEAGQPLFLLYAVYSTADSFGYDTNSNIDYIDVYRTQQEVDLVIELINKHIEFHNFCDARGEKEAYAKFPMFKGTKGVLVVPGGDGQNMTLYCPWEGYFESLGYLSTYQFRIVPVLYNSLEL